MVAASFTIAIPEEGWPRLLEFLDKEFPHCKECGSRFDPPAKLSGSSTVAVIHDTCSDCRVLL
jgi:hypothetical protein